MYTKNFKYIQWSYKKKEPNSNSSGLTGFGPKRKTPTSLEQKLKTTDKKNAQKLYAGYIGSSGLPLGDEHKYSNKEKAK